MKALSSNKREKYWKKIKGFWKGFDIYGEKVEFTYKGKKSYQTSFGAFFSIIVWVIIILYLYYQADMTINRKHPMTLTKYLLNDYSEPFDVIQRGFDIAFGFDIDIDTSYGYFVANKITSNRAQNTIVYQTLEIQKCQFEHFNHNSKEDIVNYGVYSHYCFTNTSIAINGDLGSLDYSYINIQLVQCQNTTTSKNCKSQTDIDSYFDSKELKVSFVNSNYNFKEFKKDPPIEYYIDDTYGMDLDQSKERKLYLYIQDAFASRYDDLVGFWIHKEEKFFQVQNIREKDDKINSTTKALASITVSLDKRTLYFVRVVESIVDLLEQIGGFKESMHIIGLFIVIFFQERLFLGSFARQLYQRKIAKQEIKQDKDEVVKVGELQDNSHEEAADRIGEGQTLHSADSKKIMDNILARTRFKYSYRQIFDYLCKCFCIRNFKRNHKTESFRDHILYKKAEKKLEDEFDAVNLIRGIRKLRLMSKIILPSRARMLLKFQKQNLLALSSSSSDSDDQRYDTMKLLDHKKGLVKLSAITKIKKSMRYYEDHQLTPLDKDLLRGVLAVKEKQPLEGVSEANSPDRRQQSEFLDNSFVGSLNMKTETKMLGNVDSSIDFQNDRSGNLQNSYLQNPKLKQNLSVLQSNSFAQSVDNLNAFNAIQEEES